MNKHIVRSLKQVVVGFSILSSLAITGCGGGGGPGGGAEGSGSANLNRLSFCQQEWGIFCDKTWDCAPADVRKSDEFKNAYGNSVADCKTKFQQEYCNETKSRCNIGTAFDVGNADQCLKEFGAYSCDDFESGRQPAICIEELICKK